MEAGSDLDDGGTTKSRRKRRHHSEAISPDT